MKNTTNTPNSALQTDFYQLTMSYAKLMLGSAGEITGFESFFRHIKPEVAGDSPFYIFSGEKEVHEFMAIVKKEFNSPDFFDRFWKMFSNKIDKSVRESNYIIAKKAFDSIPKDFEYTVLPEGTKAYPKVPVFQFKGSNIIGQMIETPITNIVNGRTGAKSFRTFFPDRVEDITNIEAIMNEPTAQYIQDLNGVAMEYRNATSKVLLEAGFRRSASFAIAVRASKIAIDNGWEGTSNTALFGSISPSLINGTMAHAFVMGFEKEVDAFFAWDKIFPKSTILIDTYDTVNAVKILIENNIRPASVRIDSDPIEKLAFEVRRILDEAGWTEVKIFLSGDITPEKLIRWEEEKVPFDMCMAGTKFVNIDEMHFVNAGFVYKIVEYEKDGRTYFPFKKAFGKSNYPGLKTVSVDSDGDISMSIGRGFEFGFNNVDMISDNADIAFFSRIDFSNKGIHSEKI